MADASHLLQETNFTIQNQEKLPSLTSKGTDLSVLSCGSFQKCAIITSSDDSILKNKVSDVGSCSSCLEKKQKQQDFNQERLKCCEHSSFDENGLLDAKKRQLLAELEAGSVFKSRIFVKDSVNRLNMKAGIFKGFKGVNDCVKQSLNVEMVDDTALIGPVLKLKNCVGSARIAERNGRRNENQENNGWKPKRKWKHVVGNGCRKSEAHVRGVWNDGPVKRKYSRKEMEGLRFLNVVEQKKIWRNVFSRLGNDVVQEYKALATNSKAHTNNPSNCDHKQNHGRREGPPIFLGVLGARGTWNPLNTYVRQGMA